MSATAEMIAKVRRMVAEPTTANYSDAQIAGYIEMFPMSYSSPTDYTGLVVDPWDTRWVPTYDLHSAAADIWAEKAAALQGNYDISADDAVQSRSQGYDQAMGQERYHRARRSANTIRLRPMPSPSGSALAIEAEDMESGQVLP